MHLYNRFLQVEIDGKLRIGGRQQVLNNELVVPPRIEISISHEKKSEARITLYNLSKETVREIDKRKLPIVVEAGYWPQNGSKQAGPIYQGKIENTITNREGADRSIELICTSGNDAIRYARTRKNLPAATTHEQILSQLLKDMPGIEKGDWELDGTGSFVEKRPLTIDRPSFAELDDICHQHNLLWTVIDDRLHIRPMSTGTKTDPWLVSPDTGQIGSPRFAEDSVSVDLLLVYWFRPGMNIRLANPYVEPLSQEVHHITKVSFSGNNQDGEFKTSLDCSLPKPKKSRSRRREKKV